MPGVQQNLSDVSVERMKYLETKKEEKKKCQQRKTHK